MVIRYNFTFKFLNNYQTNRKEQQNEKIFGKPSFRFDYNVIKIVQIKF